MKVNTAKGTFKGMEGDISFHPDNPSASSFNVCVDASTVNTENKERDEHLKTADFFDAEQFPDICFVSSYTQKTNDGYQVLGILTMHGITKDIIIPFTYTNESLIGQFKINRDDYEVGKDINSFMAGNEITVEIICILNEK